MRGAVQNRQIQLLGNKQQKMKSDFNTSMDYNRQGMNTTVAASNSFSVAISTKAADKTFASGEFDESSIGYPKNRHIDQVCKTFYR